MKRDLRINKRDNIIFGLFSLWLIVDSVNGFLLRNDIPIPVSQLFKLFVAILVVIRCYRHSNAQKLLLWITLYLLLYSANILWRGEDFASSMILLSKFLTTCIFFLYFSFVAISNQKFFKKEAFKVFKINLIVFVGNILLGLLGIGYHSYTDNDGIGYCGFFYAINEMSGVVAALFPWAFYFFIKNISIKKYYLASMVLFVVAFLLSTKSGMLATALSFVLITYMYGGKAERMLIAVGTVLLVIIAAIYIQNLLNSEVAVIQRFNYFLEQRGVVDTITSGRLTYWEEEGREFYDAGFVSQLFGLGGNRTVEMDPYDALLNCGIVGLGMVLYIYIFFMKRPIKKRIKTLEYSRVVWISNFLLIIISVIGGHILFSSMAGLFIALSNSTLYCRYEKNISNSQFISFKR